MAIYQCKICGGDLDVPEGSNVGVCEYCGTKQTVGDAQSEKTPPEQPQQTRQQPAPEQSAPQQTTAQPKQSQKPFEDRAAKQAYLAQQQAVLEQQKKAEKKQRRRKRHKIEALVLLALLVLATVTVTVILPNSFYHRAMTQLDAGDYVSAYRTLVLLRGFKDSEQKKQDIRLQAQMQSVAQAAVKDEVTFGSYEQDGKAADGKEDIFWIVLDKTNDKALLVSKYALDFRPYAETGDITWQNSSLRAWLNDAFLSEAFSKQERAAIAKTAVAPDKNPAYGADPGEATKDKLFVLSRTEVRTYFSLAESAYCKATPWAAARDTSDLRLSSKWWTRTPGSASGRVMAIGALTSIIGEPADDTGTAVRPAMWIKIGTVS